MSDNKTATLDRDELDATELDAATPVAGSGAKKSAWQRFYSSDFSFNFVGRRRMWFTISVVTVLICVLILFVRGLKLGVEFTGGSVFQASVAVTDQTIPEVTKAVNDTGLANLSTQVSTLGSNSIRVNTRSLNSDEVVQVRQAVASFVGTSPDNVTYTLIGPSWGQQITNQGIVALTIFLVLVFALIWTYFRDWKMSISAIIALVHDMVVTVGIYALVGFTVTPASLIGFLTILGYSLYDKVVVFDKVQEATRDIARQQRSYAAAANAGINQVMVRSINTTIIAALPVLAILIAGVVILNGEGPLANLGLALFIGILTGAYSSLCIATSLLVSLREREPAIQRHNAALAKGHKQQRKIETVTVEQDTKIASAPAVSLVKAQTHPATDPRPASRAGSGRPQPKNSPRNQRKK